MLFLHFFLVRIFLERCTALLCAISAILSVGALVDGKTPEILILLLDGLPCALCLAACWTLADWRREGGQTACAAGGRSPWFLVMTLLACTTPGLGVISMARITPQGQLQVEPDRITVTDQSGKTEFIWSEGMATRHDPDGRRSSTDRVPAPKGSASLRKPRAFIHILPGFALFCALWLLAFKREPMGLSATLAAAGIAFIGGEFLRNSLLSI